MKKLCSALFALAVLGAATAYSQSVNATLLGTVTDSSGAVVPNAKVTITETNTNISHSAATNESGNYSFPDLPPGRYAVVAEQTGFKRESRRDIDVLVDSTVRINIALQPGNVSETVEVTGAPPTLQADRADTSEKIEVRLVEDAPLGNNRNFQSLLNLIPGTAPATFQHSQFFNASSSLQTEVNGQMREGNNFLIEGTDDNERTGLLQILVPPIEAIQTVDVATSNFDPEMGRATGAVTNVILKSGGNAFHGAAYEFLQNSDLDARAFFNPTIAPVHYNYVGGNIGGPIKKNKLFFFGDYLRVMDVEGTATNETIPSPAFRGGNLSAAPTVIYDPATGNPATGAGRLPFAGNMIPANRINQVSANILNLLPEPNEAYNQSNPSNNYYAALPFSKTTDSFDTKMDYNITDKDRLSGRISFARPVIFQAPIFGDAGGDANGAFEGTGTQKTYSSGLNYDHVFSPTLLTEARIGVAHYHNVAQPSDYGKDDATTLGIPGVNISQFTSGEVGINLGGYTEPLIGYSASVPWIRAEANVDIVNTWTKIMRNHTFKFGADLRRIRDDLLQDQTFSPRGIETFGTNQTGLCVNPSATGSCASQSTQGFGNDFASFLLDSPSQVGRDLNTYFPAYREWQFFAFAGDKWQVSQKLTIDLGLRWEFYPPATPEFAGGFSNYNPITNQLVIAGIGGNPSNLGMQTRYKNWAPRTGFAYRLDDKTVIRGGFGMSYVPYTDNNYAYNYPVRANNAYNPVGNGYGPAVLADGVTPASFQAGFPAPVPIVIPQNGIITPQIGTTLNSQNEIYIPLSWKNPYVESWNIAIQRALPWHFTLDVAYVANHGVDSVASPNINSVSVAGSGTAGEPEAIFGRTASTTQDFSAYSSHYNSLQVKFNRRFATGLLITTSFTWQKDLSYQSDDDGGLTFFIDQRRNYAPTDFDRTFNYVQSYVYELPFGPGKRMLNSGAASHILGGWQVSAILTLETGIPIQLTANGGSLNSPGSTQTPNQIAPVTYPKGINVGNPWFSTTSFAQPTGAGVFGNVGRNPIFGPGLFGLNASLFKHFRITERINAELRGEAFQITNSPQFGQPQGSLTSSTFGYVTGTLGSGSGVNGTGGGRAFQLGFKLSF
ncbi:MAG: carboxypeptidase regulatory-like domain-containing protein [Bryobacteraceae bacterium]